MPLIGAPFRESRLGRSRAEDDAPLAARQSLFSPSETSSDSSLISRNHVAILSTVDRPLRRVRYLYDITASTDFVLNELRELLLRKPRTRLLSNKHAAKPVSAESRRGFNRNMARQRNYIRTE